MNYIFIMRNGLFKLFLNNTFQACYFITRFTISDAKNNNLEIHYTT